MSEENQSSGSCWPTPRAGKIDGPSREDFSNNLHEVAETFMDQSLPSSQRVSRANPSQLREAVREMMTAVISGPKSPECFAKLSPNGFWVKTSGGYSLFPTDESSGTFSGTWPTWGIASDGDVTELTKPQEQPTEGIGSSSLGTKWQTPSALPFSKRRQVGQTERTELLLPAQAETWRTSSAVDVEGGIMEMRDGCDGKYKLRDHAPGAMENWPTPTTRDHKDGTSGDTVEPNALLGRVAPAFSLPAPQTSTHGQESCETDPTSPPPLPSKRRLNYRFVQALMGFPEGWL